MICLFKQSIGNKLELYNRSFTTKNIRKKWRIETYYLFFYNKSVLYHFVDIVLLNILNFKLLFFLSSCLKLKEFAVELIKI
jgi:hypothetical protein